MTRALIVLVTLVLAAAAPCQRADQRTAKVGARARIEQLVLPGPELQARPISDTTKDPIVLRVLATWPHGVADDGILGPRTLAAANAANPEVLRARMVGQRLRFLTGLRTFGTFGAGWVRRCADILAM